MHYPDYLEALKKRNHWLAEGDDKKIKLTAGGIRALLKNAFDTGHSQGVVDGKGSNSLFENIFDRGEK